MFLLTVKILTALLTVNTFWLHVSRSCDFCRTRFLIIPHFSLIWCVIAIAFPLVTVNGVEEIPRFSIPNPKEPRSIPTQSIMNDKVNNTLFLLQSVFESHLQRFMNWIVNAAISTFCCECWELTYVFGKPLKKLIYSPTLSCCFHCNWIVIKISINFKCFYHSKICLTLYEWFALPKCNCNTKLAGFFIFFNYFEAIIGESLIRFTKSYLFCHSCWVLLIFL